ncbi:olfactory receptor 142-like, partial [Austrofundulus limnaeus]|uniref:Olfactory receptor n=1 Tax=Austrofundulus limnaeus TaxID=52670 RepID=A0A2I4D3J6_AUSLI
CLIVIHKNLHEPMYIFIAALLINSVLFSTGVYPKLLIDFLSEKQVISYTACLFQVFVFYSLSCSEFLLLAAMAFDRYVSICKPLQYHTIMRKTTVSVFLVLSWLISFCHIAVPVIGNANQKLCSFTLKGIYCNNLLNYTFCVSSRGLLIFGLVALFDICLLPIMFFIMFTYTVILVIVYRSCREVRKKAAQTCLPHQLVLINYSFLLTFDMIIVRLESSISKIASFVIMLQMITYNPLCNPIIYGLKITEIYKHHKRLFIKTRLYLAAMHSNENAHLPATTSSGEPMQIIPSQSLSRDPTAPITARIGIKPAEPSLDPQQRRECDRKRSHRKDRSGNREEKKVKRQKEQK